MWCQEAYSLRSSPNKYDHDVDIQVSFNTIQQLRSAASQYMAWDRMVSHPDKVIIGQDKCLLYQACHPMDSLGYTLHSCGMQARLGDEARPSVALLDCHVRSFNNELNTRYLAATDPIVKWELALAGFTNMVLWLGWLRSSECFGLQWDDCMVLEPSDGPRMDLPTGCGLLALLLSPETKSNCTQHPEVILAYRTMSGYSAGLWYHRAWHSSGLSHRSCQTSTRLIFSHPDGTPWTSSYFWQTHLYPSLHHQRLQGDAALTPYDRSSAGNTIEAKCWSLHAYCRGARSHISRGGLYGKYCFKKASTAQVYEHAHWRYRRSSEAIDVMYRKWTPHDCIKITLYSQ